MRVLRRINLSAALVGLICFFLPWVQVSCAGARDSLSGLDLARDGRNLLWLVPILLIGIVLLGFLRAMEKSGKVYALTSILAGAVTAYLMNRERLRTNDESGVITVQLTGWFWLGLFSALALAISGLAIFIHRKRST